MSSTKHDSIRIVKNTLILYVRMIFLCAMLFVSTRILLKNLGINDYGLVNVISGIVTMFSFLSGMMQTSCSRFFNVSLGKGDFTELSQIFNLSQNIYIALMLIILILTETVGLWFLKTKVVISPERYHAAFWFFQFSLFVFLFKTLSIPYSALIISHENMIAYSWITISEAVLHLIFIYLLMYVCFDRLIAYGAMLFVASVIIFLVNFIICRKLYPESKARFYYNKKRYIEFISFSCWNIFGAAAGLFTNVFINVLLNNYFGLVVNAARGIAVQVSAAITSFTQNFMTATNPKIIQYYSSGEQEQCHLLVMRASKIAFLLLFFFSLPAWILMPFLLKLWLDIVPEHTLWFSRLILIQLLIDSFSYPLMTLAMASGKIAVYQSVVGGLLWCNLPAAWIILHFFRAIPESVAIIAIVISCVCLMVRLLILKKTALFPVFLFVRKTFLPSLTAAGCASAIPFLLNFTVLKQQDWTQFFTLGITCCICTFFFAAFIALTKTERTALFGLIRMKLKIW